MKLFLAAVRLENMYIVYVNGNYVSNSSIPVKKNSMK